MPKLYTISLQAAEHKLLRLLAAEQGETMSRIASRLIREEYKRLPVPLAARGVGQVAVNSGKQKESK